MGIYIFLGILQGIFEWIPISSEGIVALTSQYFLKEFHPIDLAIFLHLGTFFAAIIYFRKDWKEVLTLKNKDLFYFLIIATLTSLLVSFPLYQSLKKVAIGASLLMIMSFGLFLTSFLEKRRKFFDLNLNQLAILSGFLQGLSVIPGLSRSGSTIFGLSLAKKNPSEILKISYMMSAPVILLGSFYLYFKNPLLLREGWISLIFSFLVGISTLHYLIKFSQRINFRKFTLIFALLCFLGAILGFYEKGNFLFSY